MFGMVESPFPMQEHKAWGGAGWRRGGMQEEKARRDKSREEESLEGLEPFAEESNLYRLSFYIPLYSKNFNYIL